MAKKGEKNKERKGGFRDLRKRYRLSVINERTFEERFSIHLTRLNVVAMIGAVFFVVAIITVGIIFLTPISELVPGHTTEESWKKTVHASNRADSLAAKLAVYERYMDHTLRILRGEVVSDSSDVALGQASSTDQLDLDPSMADSLFRDHYGKAEAYNIYQDEMGGDAGAELSSIFFFTPLRGVISSEFDPVNDHLGIDVLAPKDEAIKAVLDGTVVMATWTSSAGYVLQVQHPNDLLSVYKHNSVLLKKEGEKVKAGEAVAVIGDTGELTDGPHLHFELWYRGEPIDPQQHMVFD